MKTSTLERNGVSMEMVDLIGRLMGAIAWPARRRAMGDVTVTLLDGKPRVAEDVFGWNRKAVELGIHEYQTGLACVNDITARGKPKTEDKYPKLLAEIQAIMESHSQSEASLRTTLPYTNMTAKTVHEALVKKGWPKQSLPSVRTMSNLLNRQNDRLRIVTKFKVQKKPTEPKTSLQSSST